MCTQSVAAHMFDISIDFKSILSYLSIISAFIKYIVKIEVVLLDVLSQIDLIPILTSIY